VWNAGTFTSTGSTITGNIASSVRNVADGAGVYRAIGKVDLIDTHITKNKATGVHSPGRRRGAERFGAHRHHP
jgi:hypothetical protein